MVSLRYRQKTWLGWPCRAFLPLMSDEEKKHELPPAITTTRNPPFEHDLDQVVLVCTDIRLSFTTQ